MILIRFPSTESKRLALACLASRFAFKSWATGEMLVPEDALAFLAVRGITFAVEGVATYPRTKPLAATFLAGVGSALEILPPSTRIEAAQTDAEAVVQDCATVAADLWLAIGSHLNESTEEYRNAVLDAPRRGLDRPDAQPDKSRCERGRGSV